MADLSKTLPLTRSSVQAAHELIRHHIHLTPVLTSTTLSTLASTPQSPDALEGTEHKGQEPARPKINLFFKCENYQKIGAFKARGAFHALARLSDEELKKGVVTHSSGKSLTSRNMRRSKRCGSTSIHLLSPPISTTTHYPAHPH
jgi:threonine dehydratase